MKMNKSKGKVLIVCLLFVLVSVFVFKFIVMYNAKSLHNITPNIQYQYHELKSKSPENPKSFGKVTFDAKWDLTENENSVGNSMVFSNAENGISLMIASSTDKKSAQIFDDMWQEVCKDDFLMRRVNKSKYFERHAISDIKDLHRYLYKTTQAPSTLSAFYPFHKLFDVYATAKLRAAFVTDLGNEVYEIRMDHYTAFLKFSQNDLEHVFITIYSDSGLCHYVTISNSNRILELDDILDFVSAISIED